MSALSRLIKHSLLLGNSEIIFRQKNVPRQIIYSWTLDPVKAVAYKLHIWKEKYIYFSYPRILSNRKVFIYLHIAWFLKGRNPLIKAHWKFFLLISCRCYFNSSLFPLPFPDHLSALHLSLSYSFGSHSGYDWPISFRGQLHARFCSDKKLDRLSGEVEGGETYQTLSSFLRIFHHPARHLVHGLHPQYCDLILNISGSPSFLI